MLDENLRIAVWFARWEVKRVWLQRGGLWADFPPEVHRRVLVCERAAGHWRSVLSERVPRLAWMLP